MVAKKREAELQRPRSRQGGNPRPVTKGQLRPVSIPRIDPDWHPIAQNVFKSLKTSGQAEFYQNSDWHLAYSLCDDLSTYKYDEDYRSLMQRLQAEWERKTRLMSSEERKEYARENPRPAVPRGGSAMKIQMVYDGLARLLATEADRRKVQLELHAAPSEAEQSAEVIAIDEYRRRLGA